MKRTPFRLAALTALTLGLSTGSATLLAQTATSNAPVAPAAASGAMAGGTASRGQLSAADRHFLMDAAMGGMAEVQLGELAQRNGASDAVKAYGARMVRDHGQANTELMAIASAKGVQPPAQPDKKHTQLMAKLQKLSGEAFDREYTRAMHADHKKDVAAFERQARSGQDADLKAFAEKTLPTLKEHLNEVQTLSGNHMADKRHDGNAR